MRWCTKMQIRGCLVSMVVDQYHAPRRTREDCLLAGYVEEGKYMPETVPPYGAGDSPGGKVSLAVGHWL